ncbi:hypothetical protein NMD1_03667 [Novosphingobium sp. MD-1]|nr:hypothetical protein NMD1_03667 [Novosphingobium sp. MD-1]
MLRPGPEIHCRPKNYGPAQSWLRRAVSPFRAPDASRAVDGLLLDIKCHVKQLCLK